MSTPLGSSSSKVRATADAAEAKRLADIDNNFIENLSDKQFYPWTEEDNSIVDRLLEKETLRRDQSLIREIFVLLVIKGQLSRVDKLLKEGLIDHNIVFNAFSNLISRKIIRETLEERTIINIANRLLQEEDPDQELLRYMMEKPTGNTVNDSILNTLLQKKDIKDNIEALRHVLKIAAGYDNVGAVERLLREKVVKEDIKGLIEALYYADRLNRPVVLEKLLVMFEELLQKDRGVVMDLTPTLRIAAKRGRLVFVKELLKERLIREDAKILLEALQSTISNDAWTNNHELIVDEFLKEEIVQNNLAGLNQALRLAQEKSRTSVAKKLSQIIQIKLAADEKDAQDNVPERIEALKSSAGRGNLSIVNESLRNKGVKENFEGLISALEAAIKENGLLVVERLLKEETIQACVRNPLLDGDRGRGEERLRPEILKIDEGLRNAAQRGFAAIVYRLTEMYKIGGLRIPPGIGITVTYETGDGDRVQTVQYANLEDFFRAYDKYLEGVQKNVIETGLISGLPLLVSEYSDIPYIPLSVNLGQKTWNAYNAELKRCRDNYLGFCRRIESDPKSLGDLEQTFNEASRMDQLKLFAKMEKEVLLVERANNYANGAMAKKLYSNREHAYNIVYTSCKNGSTTQVEKLEEELRNMEANRDVSLVNTLANDSSPLDIAYAYRCWETAKILLARGESGRIRPEDLLFRAAKEGDEETVRRLVSGEYIANRPMNVNEVREGYSPLDWAYENKHWGIVLSLLGCSEVPPKKNTNSPEGLLFRATRENDVITVRRLISGELIKGRHMNVHLPDNEGNTVLDIAIQQQFWEVAKAILDCGGSAKKHTPNRDEINRNAAIEKTSREAKVAAEAKRAADIKASAEAKRRGDTRGVAALPPAVASASAPNANANAAADAAAAPLRFGGFGAADVKISYEKIEQDLSQKRNRFNSISNSLLSLSTGKEKDEAEQRRAEAVLQTMQLIGDINVYMEGDKLRRSLSVLETTRLHASIPAWDREITRLESLLGELRATRHLRYG